MPAPTRLERSEALSQISPVICGERSSAPCACSIGDLPAVPTTNAAGLARLWMRMASPLGQRNFIELFAESVTTETEDTCPPNGGRVV